jgi:glucuronoarabinoxylan endo-1,4-beta-xylanase
MFKKMKKLLFGVGLCIIAATLAFNYTAPLHAAGDITVNATDLKQTIKGFGGINHPVWISDLTESQTTTAFGNGEGQIGMSILRMHVDEDSGNWSREVATAQRAIALGATVFASPWNPPSSMTEVVNGKKRLKYDQYGAYTNHLNSFISYMKQNGVDLYAISIQNEPDYAYDWTWWTATEIVNYLKQNAASLQTRVMAPESFQYVKSMSDPILNDSQALANLDILGAHLYGTALNNFPYPLFKQKGQGKELWMTEVYTDSTNDADLWPTALDVAYNIHNSMVEAEFNAYVWWYIRRSYGMIKENGQVSKRGYCMAQFSKFVRPGYVRVDATKNPTTDVYVSAYKNDQKMVVVVVNRSASSKNLSLSINGATVQSLTRYTTSGSKNVKNDGTVNSSNGSFALSLDAQSVTTFVGSLAGATPTPTSTSTPTPTPTGTVAPTPTPTPTGTVAPTPTPTVSANPTGCSVSYSQNDWGSGATVSITIKNNGAGAINGWTLAWNFAGNQTITNIWNATYTQSGTAVTAKNVSYNSAIPANGSVTFGFNLAYSGVNAKPTSFTLNGTACQLE